MSAAAALLNLLQLCDSAEHAWHAVEDGRSKRRQRREGRQAAKQEKRAVKQASRRERKTAKQERQADKQSQREAHRSTTDSSSSKGRSVSHISVGMTLNTDRCPHGVPACERLDHLPHALLSVELIFRAPVRVLICIYSAVQHAALYTAMSSASCRHSHHGSHRTVNLLICLMPRSIADGAQALAELPGGKDHRRARGQHAAL